MTKQSKTIFLLALALTVSSCAFKKDSKSPGEARPTPHDSHPVEKKSLMIQRENEETYTSTFLELGINHYQLSNPLILEVNPMPKSFTFTMKIGELENISRVKALASGPDYTDKRVNVLINSKRTLKGVTFVDLTIEDVSELGLPNQHEKTARLDLYLSGAVYSVEFRTTPAPVSVTSRAIEIGKEKNVAFDQERDLRKVGELEFSFKSDESKIVLPRKFTTDLLTEYFSLVHTSNFPASEMGPGNRDYNSPTDEECGVSTQNSFGFATSKPTTFILGLHDESPDSLSASQDESITITKNTVNTAVTIDIYAMTKDNGRVFSDTGKCSSNTVNLINGCNREACVGANGGKCVGGRWHLIVRDYNHGNYENQTTITGKGVKLDEWFSSAVLTYKHLDTGSVNRTGRIMAKDGFNFTMSGQMNFKLPKMEPPASCN